MSYDREALKRHHPSLFSYCSGESLDSRVDFLEMNAPNGQKDLWIALYIFPLTLIYYRACRQASSESRIVSEAFHGPSFH